MNYKSMLVLLVLCVLLVACGGSGDATLTPTPSTTGKGDLWVNCPGIWNDFIVCRECTKADASGAPPKGCSYELR